MPQKLDIRNFLQDIGNQEIPLVDVRSPKEYAKGHIPQAVSLPIFKDDERALVGTMYKQQGREQAIRQGLEIVGPKMGTFVDEVSHLAGEKKLFLHCWRGGMRSESMAWLFELSGFKVSLLEGGYKAYRQQLIADFTKPWKLHILGGRTGSGKTDILHALAQKGEQVLDLEALAHHKGSAFGALFQPPQPTTEQFENDLHEQLSLLDPQRVIWVEDESHAIGRVHIPHPFWLQMQQAPVTVVDVPFEIRVKRLVREYANAPDDALADSLSRIEKRLGGQHVKRAQEALKEGDYAEVARVALRYYDKAYDYGLAKKEGRMKVLDIVGDDPGTTASLILS